MRTVPKSKNKKLSSSKGLAADKRVEARTESAAAGATGTEVTSEEKHQLVAEAAYFRAERRNFSPGCELEDWLGAEAEIEMRLSKICPAGPPKNA
jgi:hypothetical protein